MTAVSGRNRDRIVAAARDLFYQQGYRATSFSDIARVAQIPRGNFYFYFKAKNEIFESVVDQWLVTLRRLLGGWEAQFSDPRERLLHFVRFPLQNIEEVERYGCPFGTLIVEMGKKIDNESLRCKAFEIFKLIVGWLEGQFALLARDTDPRMLALRTLGRMQGASVVCNAYRERDYLEYELRDLEAWIKGL